jgi:putative peptidoglycan lipid II flippase
MGPTVLGSAIYLVNMAVARLLGLSLNESAAAVLNLAGRLMELPIGVFAIAVTTVVFPVIAQHAAAGDRPALAGAYRQGLRLILLVNVPAAVGLAVLAGPIIRVLFQRGAFSADDTALMLPVLAVFAAGLPFLAVVSLMLRGFYAHKDTVTPVRAAAWSFVLNLGLSLTLMRVWGTVGLALASNLAVVFQAIYLQFYLRRRDPGLAFAPVGADLGKMIGAALVMGGVVLAARLGLTVAWPATGLGREALHLALLVPLGGAVYAGLVWALRVEGREELSRLLRRKLGRRGPGEVRT